MLRNSSDFVKKAVKITHSISLVLIVQQGRLTYKEINQKLIVIFSPRVLLYYQTVFYEELVASCNSEP